MRDDFGSRTLIVFADHENLTSHFCHPRPFLRSAAARRFAVPLDEKLLKDLTVTFNS